MNRHYTVTDFETMRIPQLENIHRKVTRKMEALQEKMAGDMKRVGYHDILPRNYNILPIDECSFHDRQELNDLHEQVFTSFWVKEQKKAELNNTMDQYHAEYKLACFKENLNDNEWRSFLEYCANYSNLRNTLDIQREIRKNPSFLEPFIKEEWLL